MRTLLPAILGALLVISGDVPTEVCAAASPQEASALPNPAGVVKPHAYVSLAPVPKGKQFEIAVVADIARGFHINSHHPSDAYLIPTTLAAQLPAGFQLLDTHYPAGRLEKFSFSPQKPLDVYTGSVTLQLRLLAHPNAALGATIIPVTLRFQACNDTTCLPPVNVSLRVPLEVAAAGARARAVHPEIFSAVSPKN